MMWKKIKFVIATVAILTLTGFGATRLAFRAEAEPPAVTPGQAEPALPAPVAESSPQPKDERIPPLDVTAPETVSKNFDVSGTSPIYCQEITRRAETHRASLAKLWLGKELPDWPKPCPVRVTISATPASGATTIAFDGGSGAPSQITLSGLYDRILNSVLPHEITHTVLATHFRQSIPRWADEGAAVLSEDEPERKRHDELMVKLLQAGRAMRLSHLFQLKEYPSDVVVLFAQGYSVTRFLVEKGGHTRFLEFVQTGMKDGWTVAARDTYNIAEINDLETEWLDWLRKIHREMPLAKPLPLKPANTVHSPPPPATPLAPIGPPQSPSPVEPPQAAPLPPPAPAYSFPTTTSGLIVVQATMDKDGTLVCKFPKTTYYEPVTTYQRDPTGATRATTSYVRRSVQEERSYKPDQIYVTGTDGKRVDAKDLAKRLEKETPVVFIQGVSLDPRLLSLLKEGTLIVSSGQKVTAVPALPPASLTPPPAIPQD